MGYEVRTPVFEGPFDLLLHLILKQEVDLWEVSLATIVDAYLAELERMESLDLEIATEFLLIAATLVELKARRLLPGRRTSSSTRSSCASRSATCSSPACSSARRSRTPRTRCVALMRRADRSVARAAGPEEPFRSLVPDPLERVCVPSAPRRGAPGAVAATGRAGRHRPHRADPRERRRRDRGRPRPPAGRALRSRSATLAADAASRLDAIVRFLAVLELFKQGVVDLEQTENFGDARGPAHRRTRRARPGERRRLGRCGPGCDRSKARAAS